MKKKKVTVKLNLNKKAISNLNSRTVNGGWFTTGCSDGCTPVQTAWNCTGTFCSNDCNNGVSREPACTQPGDQFLGF